MSPKGNLVARLALLTLELAAAAPAHAETDSVPAPKAIIYPGDLITDDMLADIPAPSGVSEAPAWSETAPRSSSSMSMADLPSPRKAPRCKTAASER